MKNIIIANWKMKLNEKQSIQLAKEYRKIKVKRTVEVVVAPSFPMLNEVVGILKGTDLIVGAQNVAVQASGTFTGEVSSEMLSDLGCKYVIVGHSERRTKMNETDEMINKKINQVYHAKMTPILCIGETLEENKIGQRDSVLVRQLQRDLSKVDCLPEKELVIAYEPIWAIGSGQYMEPEEMQIIQRVVKRAISSLYSEKFYDEKVRLIYGGSVNNINAKDFLAQNNVRGLLIATASLEANSFNEIVKQAE